MQSGEVEEVTTLISLAFLLFFFFFWFLTFLCSVDQLLTREVYHRSQPVQSRKAQLVRVMTLVGEVGEVREQMLRRTT